MSFLDSLLRGLLTKSTDPATASSVGGGDDPLVRDVTKLACDMATNSFALTPDAAEEPIADIVIGLINAALNQRTGRVRERAFQAQLDIARAQEQEQVADQAAGRLDQEANDIEGTTELKSARVREAKEQLHGFRERIQEMPLVARVRTPWVLIVIAVAGSASGVGALAHLSLEAVNDEIIKWTVTVAAGCVAFAAELVIGTLSADNYDRIPEEMLRRVVPVVLMLVVGLIVGTELFAAKVRQEGLEATQSYKVASTASAGRGGPLAPSLIWTGPLAVLATVTGSGVVGMTRLRESRKRRFDDAEDAAARLKAAESSVKRDEENVKRFREEATRRREQAAQLRGTASTAQAHNDNLSATLRQMSQQHTEQIRAITQQAKLVYRIQAERYGRIGEEQPEVKSALARALPLTVGLSVLAGALCALLTHAVIPSLIVGSAVMIVSALRTTRTPT
jgi:hypothetical protein